MRKQYLLALALACISTSAWAQIVERTELTAVKNVVSGFPKRQVTDVLGVSIGMPFQAAADTLRSQFPDVETTLVEDLDDGIAYFYREMGVLPEAKTNNGFKIVFDKMPIQLQTQRVMVTDESRKSFPGGTTFKLGFGSNATGNLVQIIVRDSLFETPAKRADLFGSIVNKYGSPTYVNRIRPGEDEIYYLYAYDEVLEADHLLGTDSDCTRSSYWSTGERLFTSGELFYQHQIDRGENDRCSAAMTFRLSSNDARADEVLHLEVTIVDHDAIYQDRKAIDSQVDEAYDAFMSSAGGSAAPKL